MISMKKKLNELGLSKNEGAVYLTLLKLCSASAGKITEQSGVHRRNVYDALERLGKRGLVSHEIKGRTKHFRAASPMNLLQIIEDDRESLRIKEDKAQSIASGLMPAFMRSRENKASVTIHKGVRGIRTVLEDILSTGEENRVLGAHRPPEVIASYLTNFHTRRVKLGIRNRLIFNNDFERSDELAKLPHTKVKRMPIKQDKTTAINIYGDKVAILSWSEPISILIEDRKIADNFRCYFDFLWKTLK